MSIPQLATLKQNTKDGQKAVLPIALKFLEDAGSPKKDILANVLIERAKAGLEKYPNVLQTDNGHVPLTDVYQELCDAFMYAIQHIEETNKNITLPYKILDILEYVTDVLENIHE